MVNVLSGGTTNPDQLRLDGPSMDLGHSRKPADLEAFCSAAIEAFAKAETRVG